MFLKHREKSDLALLSSVLIIFLSCVVEVQAQRAGSNAPSMRDQARAIQRAEIDRLLISSLPARTDSKSNRAEVLKQIRTDFKELQELNNKMMATAWARDSLDYSFLADMISRIREKANRLKTNLNLPTPADSEKAASFRTISGSSEFRNALLGLDETIMRFVNNPLFQKVNTLEIDLAMKARHDLESIILLTSDLKKTASRLNKVSPGH
jgi:hypothetical protein